MRTTQPGGQAARRSDNGPTHRPTDLPSYNDTFTRLIEVVDDNGTKKILEVLDTWRIEDEWWREPIERQYYELLLDGGKRLIVYEELPGGEWFAQK